MNLYTSKKFYCLTLAVCLALIFLLMACSSNKSMPPNSSGPFTPFPSKKYQGSKPFQSKKGYTQKGIASWYGPNFHGNPTASGEIYNMYALTAAHRTLPLHTRIRVRNLNNDKQLNVRINDRGPFIKNRILDLSYAAAKKLGVIGPGTAPVKIVVLAQESQDPAQKYYIQTASFEKDENARKAYKKLQGKGYKNSRILKVKINGKKFWRVQAGAFHALQEARKALQRLSKENPHSFIVAD